MAPRTSFPVSAPTFVHHIQPIVTTTGNVDSVETDTAERHVAARRLTLVGSELKSDVATAGDNALIPDLEPKGCGSDPLRARWAESRRLTKF